MQTGLVYWCPCSAVTPPGRSLLLFFSLGGCSRSGGPPSFIYIYIISKPTHFFLLVFIIFRRFSTFSRTLTTFPCGCHGYSLHHLPDVIYWKSVYRLPVMLRPSPFLLFFCFFFFASLPWNMQTQGWTLCNPFCTKRVVFNCCCCILLSTLDVCITSQVKKHILFL